MVGRVANRIADGKFTLDGNQYNLSINDPPNSLHGGVKGWSRKQWHVLKGKSRVNGGHSLMLGLHSPSGDEVTYIAFWRSAFCWPDSSVREATLSHSIPRNYCGLLQQTRISHFFTLSSTGTLLLSLDQ